MGKNVGEGSGIFGSFAGNVDHRTEKPEKARRFCQYGFIYRNGCLRFYQDALLKNCTFAEDFSWIDSGCDDISITIEDCTYEKEDGKIYDIIFNYGDFSNVIWTVDDMIVANVGTH